MKNNTVTLTNFWIVFVVYSPTRLAQKHKRFIALFELFKAFGAEGVVIVNNATGNDAATIDGYFADPAMDVIPGSNLNAEFSGWIEGVTYLRETKNIDDSASFILLNDTVFSHYPLYLSSILHYLQAAPEVSKSTKPTISGSLHNMAQRECNVLGLNLPSFVATAIFLVNAKAADLLIEQCQKVFNQWQNISGSQVDSFSLLKQFYNESGAYYVGGWLFSGGWYNASTFDNFDKNLLRLKLTAIVCEHSISARILAEQGNLLDYQTASSSQGLLRTLWQFNMKPLLAIRRYRNS
ncbi:MAG: hypothetical protein GYB58_13115 [Gammaproteobacteria bacterium]|nr:hypothetical protein [Gammaproteobacteria bacterium]